MPPSIEHLKTTHRNIGEQHRCCVGDDDYAQLEIVWNDLKLSAQLTHTYLSVYDLHKREFLFMQGVELEAEQHPVFAWQSGLITDHYLDVIHPDDLDIVLEGHIEAYELLETLPAHEKKTKSLYMLFRVNNRRGGYRLLFFRMAVFRLDRQEKLWLLLINTSLLTDCAGKEVPRGYCLGSFAQHNDKLTMRCKKASVDFLTERECEILCLIIEGYENYQISEMLGITENTLNKHRRNLEHHFYAHNMPQAVVFALKMGLH